MFINQFILMIFQREIQITWWASLTWNSTGKYVALFVKERKKKESLWSWKSVIDIWPPLSHIEWTPLSLCIDHERNNILLTFSFFFYPTKTSTWTWAYLNLFFFFSLPLILCAIFTPHTGSSYTYVCTWCTSVQPVCTTHTRIPPYPYLNIGRPKRKYI